MQPLTIMHLTASPCYGGTERQVLALEQELRGRFRSVFVSFLEEGRCWDFVNTATHAGCEAHALRHDTPRVLAALRELIELARRVDAAVLCCHGYKADLLGLLAARRLRIPVVAVSHGWTAESLRVRLFETLDRRLLRRMDRVICVSEAQAAKVRRAGVLAAKVQVIHDAVRADRFANVEPDYRRRLEAMFPRRPSVIVGAAGRLSPEKGFAHYVDAAADVMHCSLSRESEVGAKGDSLGGGGEGKYMADSGHMPVGFVLFGDGPLRGALESQVEARGLKDCFRLAGFHSDLDKFYPHLDLFVLPSYTEGLPNVVLEAYAADVPVVATAVGGTPEIIDEGINGYLVAPGDAQALARRIADMLREPQRRREMAARGQDKVRRDFSFARQAQAYIKLFDNLIPG